MKHHIAIVAKFHGPTNNIGSRFSLTLPRWENKRIYVSWQYEFNHLIGQAEAFFAEKGIEVETHAELANEYVFLVSFEQVEKVLPLFGIKR